LTTIWTIIVKAFGENARAESYHVTIFFYHWLFQKYIFYYHFSIIKGEKRWKWALLTFRKISKMKITILENFSYWDLKNRNIYDIVMIELFDNYCQFYPTEFGKFFLPIFLKINMVIFIIEIKIFEISQCEIRKSEKIFLTFMVRIF